MARTTPPTQQVETQQEVLWAAAEEVNRQGNQKYQCGSYEDSIQFYSQAYDTLQHSNFDVSLADGYHSVSLLFDGVIKLRDSMYARCHCSIVIVQSPIENDCLL